MNLFPKTVLRLLTLILAILFVAKFPKEWENYDVSKSLSIQIQFFEISKPNLNVSKLLNSFVVICAVDKPPKEQQSK